LDGGHLRLGLGFLAIEGREFASLVARGAGPTAAFLSRSLRWSAATGCMSPPASCGLLTMMAQVSPRDLSGHPAPHPVLRAILARARHHLDRRIHGRVFAGKRSMSNDTKGPVTGTDLARATSMSKAALA